MSEASEVDALRAKLAEAKAARASVEARAEAKREVERLREELASEERAAREAEVLEALEAEHGALDRALRKVETVRHGMVVLRKPHAATYRKHLDQGKHDSAALEKLVAPCLVYPSKAEWAAILDDEPHALIRAADAVIYLGGVRREDIAGK